MKTFHLETSCLPRILFIFLLLIRSIYCQRDCFWCSYNMIPSHTASHPLFVPIPAQFNHFPHIPHHLEYSYNGYEPSYPNYISYIYDDSFLPYVHPHQPFDGDGSTSASDDQLPSPVEHVQHAPPSHLDYFMNLDHYDITLPDVSTEPSWEPIDDFFLSILDRYTRFWRRYRNGTEYEDRTEEEEEADEETEKSDNILKNVDEKFKTIDRLFEENQPINLSSQLTRLENVIYEPVQSDHEELTY